MDSIQTVAEILRLPSYCCRRLSPDRVVCIVTEEWLKQLYRGSIHPLETDSNFCAFTAEKYLARSCPTIPSPWIRLTVKVWPKSMPGIQNVLEPGLTSPSVGQSLTELLASVGRENLHNTWHAAQNRFPHARLKGHPHHHHHHYGLGLTSRPQESLSDQLWHWIWRLSPEVHIRVEGTRGQGRREDGVDKGLHLHQVVHADSAATTTADLLPNVAGVLAVVEAGDRLLLVQTYAAFSLWDAVSFSPALLGTSSSRPLFVLYQALQAMVAVHARGLPIGSLSLHTVLLDPDMWVAVLCPQGRAISALLQTSPSPVSTECEGQGQSASRAHSQDSNDLSVAKPVKSSTPESSVDKKQALNQNQPTSVCASSQHLDSNLKLQTKNTATSTPLLLHSEHSSEDEALYMEGCRFLQQQEFVGLAAMGLEAVVLAWVERRLSNFQYLLVLNHLAGRTLNDPNNHPVLPWVIDFSHPHQGYRDLTKSKFRLNKGDRQLDFTFGLESSFGQASSSSNPETGSQPHHVSDVLSDITYYVYKARRMPRSILTQHVRSVWVPHEYPASMQRLHDWTPDECIPEFFTDPSVLRSTHPDLPDLEVPPWCSSTQEFVVRHMAALESERVSQHLHHWIDLTFGYKLSGKAAVSSKNVYLQLVDGHQTLRCHGILQLFTHPHPHRRPPPSRQQHALLRSVHEMVTKSQEEEQYLEAAALEMSFDTVGLQGNSAESASILLPPDYQPLQELEHCEAMQGFRNKTLLQLQEEETPPPPQSCSRQHSLVAHDMASFLCLVCEMSLAPKLRMQQDKISLATRIRNIRTLCANDLSLIPRPFQKAASILLNDVNIEAEDKSGDNSRCKVWFSPVLTGGLPPPTPSLLLHPQCEVLPFPAYFPPLHACLCRLKATDAAMREVGCGSESPAEKAAMLKQLARSKVPVVEQFLMAWGSVLGEEGLCLVLPIVESLLGDRLTIVQAAWLLFGPLSRALGPGRTSGVFRGAVCSLLGEGPASVKHIKLYHRTFLTQLLLRLHLQPFLQHCATLLVEAVAGYKDFPPPTPFYSQELLDDLDTVNDLDPAAHEAAPWELRCSPSPVPLDPHPPVPPDVEEEEEETGNEVDRDFVDAMSLGGDTAIDSLEFASKDGYSANSGRPSHASDPDPHSDDIDTQSEDLDILEDREEGVAIGTSRADGGLDSDRCSIHSISNILSRVGVVADDDDDRVFDSPRGSEGELSHNASAASLGALGRDSPGVEPGAEWAGGPQSRSDRASTEVKAGPLRVSVADRSGDEGDGVTTDGQGEGRSRTGDNMKRSETEDLMSTLSLSSPGSSVNIRHIAADSVKWLATKLGPVLAARHLSRNLVRMLPLCYLGDAQLQPLDTADGALVKTSRCVVGDDNASKVLECIGFVAALYGENIILIQYLPSIVDMISVAKRRFTQRSESGLVAALILLRFVVPLLSDKTLMDVLEDTIVGECIGPILDLLTSVSVCFPSGWLCRSVVCHKLLDVLYVLGLRLGLEMTRQFLHTPMMTFMAAFSTIHAPFDPAPPQSPGVIVLSGSEELYETIKMDAVTHQYIVGTPVNPLLLSTSPSPGNRSLSPATGPNRWHSLATAGTVDDREECLSPRSSLGQDTKEKCRQELAAVFSPEMALAAYIPLCRIFGSIHMGESLADEDLIRQLCDQQDSLMDEVHKPLHCPAQGEAAGSGPAVEDSGKGALSGALGSNVEVVGNRIQLTEEPDLPPSPSPSFSQFGRGYRHDGILHITHDELRSHDMETSKRRHLRGNWLQYWEHELGLHERDTLFNFKQIKLQSFVGHTNSIRCIVPMDTENCFISASKDKTVRLWSLTSYGDGLSKVSCQWTYQQHKKSVFSVAYIESMRQVASCDSLVHVWDPYTGVGLCQLESSRYSPAVALQAIPAPSHLVVMGTTEATLRFLDLRTYKYTHEFRCSTGSLGLLRCVGVCPEGSWVAVGFSTGVVAVLEISSGLLMNSWKAHDGEILQLKAYNKHRLVSSSFDGTLKVWSLEGTEICSLKGPNDPVHCFSFYRDQVLSATTANRIGVHSTVSENAMFTGVKLRSDTFKGVLTSMAVLPLNRTLLLGSDNGSIQLLA